MFWKVKVTSLESSKVESHVTFWKSVSKSETRLIHTVQSYQLDNQQTRLDTSNTNSVGYKDLNLYLQYWVIDRPKKTKSFSINRTIEPINRTDIVPYRT